MRQVLDDAASIKIPADYRKVKNIVINGMGGSNLGAGMIKSIWGEEIKIPVILTAGYSVPKFVNQETLYILSSYSGNTEEIVTAYAAAKKQKAKIAIITGTGEKKGKLEELMVQDKIPGYIFNPKFNPSGSPRFGVGYATLGLAAILNQAGFIKIDKNNFKTIINNLEAGDKILEKKDKNNFALKIAREIKDKTPILVISEFLIGNARVLRNQFCESAKNFASYLILPDMNHFALEGLAHPKNNPQNLIFFFIESDLYHPRNQKRLLLTKQVAGKNKIKFVSHKLKGASKLEQSLEMLQLGTWISYYLADLNNENPLAQPWVNWFKENL